MRWRPWMWLSLSMVCFVAALYFWQLGDKWAAQKQTSPATNGTNQVQPSDVSPKPAAHARAAATQLPFSLLSGAGHVNSLPTRHAAGTNSVSALAYRLSNTKEPMRTLVHNDHAILLANALLDTEKN